MELRNGFQSKKCRSCIYHRNLAGTHHLSCSKSIFFGAKVSAFVVLNPHGVKKGWAEYPFNFDPIWIEECDSFLEKEEVTLTREEYLIGMRIQSEYLAIKHQTLVKNKLFEQASHIANEVKLIATLLKPAEIISDEELKSIYNLFLNI